MSNAIQTLQQLQDGRVIAQLQTALRDASAAVRAYAKPAKITLEITVEVYGSSIQTVEPPILISADVHTKLPRAKPQNDVFFIGEDGLPTQTPTERQSPLKGLGMVDQQTGEIRNG
jgi:hypothetical protein